MSVMSINQWHDVGVTYDSNTGSAQINVDGNLYSRHVGLLAQGVNTGEIVMASLYHHGNTVNKHFHGKMACVRLWNIARDLNTIRMDTPLCNIDELYHT